MHVELILQRSASIYITQQKTMRLIEFEISVIFYPGGMMRMLQIIWYTWNETSCTLYSIHDFFHLDPLLPFFISIIFFIYLLLHAKNVWCNGIFRVWTLLFQMRVGIFFLRFRPINQRSLINLRLYGSHYYTVCCSG